MVLEYNVMYGVGMHFENNSLPTIQNRYQVYSIIV